MYCSFDTLGIARDDSKVGFGRLVRLRTALFPIPQSALRDVVAQGKLLLRQHKAAAEGLNTWRRAQLPRPHLGERLRARGGALSACSLLPLSHSQARLREKQRGRNQAALARFP